MPQCDSLYLQITDFNAFTAEEILNDSSLQIAVANVTHYAITQSSLHYQVESASFSVEFYNASGALLIEQGLCASTWSVLDVISIIVQTESANISTEIARKLDILFLNGTDIDMMNVTISLTEPGPPLSTNDRSESQLLLLLVIGSSVLAFCFFVLLACHCVNQIQLRRQWSKALQIKNGLIVSIGIGEYGPKPQDAEVEGKLKNLAVASDVENMRKLSEFLNYSFLTVENQLSWTKDEVMEYLEKDVGAKFFDDSGNAKYDGLIVSVSSHGLHHCIISSDWKMIDRTDIHRCISEIYPQIRDIPRIFLFDACAGERDRRATLEMVQVDSQSLDSIEAMESTKDGGGAAGTSSRSPRISWTSKTKNPDYNLVAIHGSTDGYVSKMQETEVGSYLTYFFVKAVKMNIERQQKKGLTEILTDVQNALHDAGKQMIKFNCFNYTGNLRIEKNQNNV